ncbi:putative glucuronosyltransferase sqv-8 [Echinococcus granulosus]|uniref:Galactosylgalactosylxylosylprotein 3-beta-glucuronosyltransferase n=2 Tax=Echinococcus granulosus TaxID=6210 RepID=W6U4W6_ECHGR|nr:putative glucuronosyltransferase sqv-8 [Echinococcus granulosus]EUB56145.1 putative glucuronosyltransferase sqv-8 [Echinococcus granulosus]
MKCRIEFVAVATTVLLVIVRCFYTVQKPNLHCASYNFTREMILRLINDPVNPLKTTVYVITPTYQRWTQKADLVRLCSTLNNVKFVHWIVVEDATEKSETLRNFFNHSLFNHFSNFCIQAPTTVSFLTAFHCFVFNAKKLINVQICNLSVPLVGILAIKRYSGLSRFFLPSRRLVTEVLSECGVPYTHLNAMSPFRRRKRVRGSAQRNKGIEWIRNHPLPNTEKGIVFFADDDNTYDPRIFKEMLTTQLGSTWPVGLVGGSKWEGCITDPKDRNKIIGFWCVFRPWRQFPFDMAAFAVNARLFTLFPTARFDYHRALEQEGLILSQLGFHSAYELEPKADGCSKVFVWHTQTRTPTVFPYFGFQPPPPGFV